MIMNKEQCEYFAKYYKAKADGKCVEFKDMYGEWCVWSGDNPKIGDNYIELRIKPEPLVYWMNMRQGWDEPSIYTSKSKAEDAVIGRNEYEYIAKRFVEDA